MLKEYHIEIVSFAETKSTLITPLKFPVQFVSSNSAGKINYTDKFYIFYLYIITFTSYEILALVTLYYESGRFRSWSRRIFRDSARSFINLQTS